MEEEEEEEEEEEQQQQPLSNKEQTHCGGWDFPFPSFTVFFGKGRDGCGGALCPTAPLRGVLLCFSP
jgi:hypothetical protein